MDGINGEVLGIEQGKGLEGISNFFKRMTIEQREAVRVVSIDRGNAFQSAVLTYLPKAAITFDPFHIIKNINDAVSKVRCDGGGVQFITVIFPPKNGVSQWAEVFGRTLNI